MPGIKKRDEDITLTRYRALKYYLINILASEEETEGGMVNFTTGNIKEIIAASVSFNFERQRDDKRNVRSRAIIRSETERGGS